MKKKTQRHDTIQSVTLEICAKDGRKLEIPLEVWQVGIVCEILGLCVDTTNLDSYRMRRKEEIDEIRKMYYQILKNLHSEERDNTK